MSRVREDVLAALKKLVASHPAVVELTPAARETMGERRTPIDILFAPYREDTGEARLTLVKRRALDAAPPFVFVVPPSDDR